MVILSQNKVHDRQSQKLSCSLEDYLEAIHIVEKKKGFCRITDIAEQLSISKASANKAVKNLKQMGFLNHEKYSTITLKESGREIAKKVYVKHLALLNFLTQTLNVPLERAEEEACKIEHVISTDTLEKLIKYSRYQSLNEHKDV